MQNNDICIFANLSAILNLCKVDNHLMERCGAFENVLKYH